MDFNTKKNLKLNEKKKKDHQVKVILGQNDADLKSTM